jgi:spore coat-associated protein N
MSFRNRRARKVSAGKLAVSAALLAAGAALVGPGAFASWTSSATGGPQSISTGTVTIALGATGTANRLTVNATGVAPGDTISRAVDLSNTGSLNLASVTLGISASPSTALDTSSSGLQLTVQSCSVAWTEAGTAPAYTYTCSGTATTVVSSTAVSTLETTPTTLSGLNALTAGGTDHLEVTLTLSTSAPTSMEGLTSTLSYNFTGTQRAAQAG